MKNRHLLSVLSIFILFFNLFAYPTFALEDEELKKQSLPAPQNLKVTETSYNSIKLVWKEVSEAFYYEIYRATSKNGKYDLIDESYFNEFVDYDLSTNKTYYYKVRAYSYDIYEYSDFSNIASGTTTFASPQNLKVVSKTGSTVKLGWSKVKYADGYEVWMASSQNGTYKKIADVESTSYTHKNLTSKTYYYKVRAYVYDDYFDEIYSGYSNITSAKINLAAPKKVKFSSKTPNSLTLSWSKVNYAEGYEIWMATKKNGKYKKVGTTKKTSFTHSKLKYKKKYYYKVRAYTNNKKEYSSFGNVISGKTGLDAPESLNTSGTSTSIAVKWKSVSGAKQYEIYRASSKNGKYKLIKKTDKTSYKDTNVKKGKTYYYKIRAVGKVNNKTIKSSYSTIKGGTAKKVYAKPNISVVLPNEYDADAYVVGMYVLNNGSKTLEILGTAYLIDSSFNGFDRTLQLIDVDSTKDKKSLKIKKKKSALVAYRVKGSSTWYDQKSTIVFNFKYDGKKYTGYASDYYGFYYEPYK